MRQLATDCETCSGTGRKDGNACPKCGGSGRVIRLVPDDTAGATPVYTSLDPRSGPTWSQVVIAVCAAVAAVCGVISSITTNQTHDKIDEVRTHQIDNSNRLKNVEKSVQSMDGVDGK